MNLILPIKCDCVLGLMITNTETDFLPVDESYTHPETPSTRE